MKYKAGDKVRVVLDRNKAYNLGSPGTNDEMWALNNCVVTIVDSGTNTTYNINEDRGKWNWTEEMFTEYISDEDEIDNKFIIISESIYIIFQITLNKYPTYNIHTVDLSNYKALLIKPNTLTI